MINIGLWLPDTAAVLEAVTGQSKLPFVLLPQGWALLIRTLVGQMKKLGIAVDPYAAMLVVDWLCFAIAVALLFRRLKRIDSPLNALLLCLVLITMPAFVGAAFSGLGLGLVALLLLLWLDAHNKARLSWVRQLSALFACGLAIGFVSLPALLCLAMPMCVYFILSNSVKTRTAFGNLFLAAFVLEICLMFYFNMVDLLVPAAFIPRVNPVLFLVVPFGALCGTLLLAYHWPADALPFAVAWVTAVMLCVFFDLPVVYLSLPAVLLCLYAARPIRYLTRGKPVMRYLMWALLYGVFLFQAFYATQWILLRVPDLSLRRNEARAIIVGYDGLPAYMGKDGYLLRPYGIDAEPLLILGRQGIDVALNRCLADGGGCLFVAPYGHPILDEGHGMPSLAERGIDVIPVLDAVVLEWRSVYGIIPALTRDKVLLIKPRSDAEDSCPYCE